MHAKPPACTGCVLETPGLGFVPPDGPPGAEILFVGESAGYTEAQTGRPFVGDAGGMLERLLKLLGWDRSSLRIDNVCKCRPPQDDLARFPSAIAHCAPYLDATLASPFLKVVVPMGTTAIKRILKVGGKKVGPENFHGTLSRDPSDRFWVVPTYHPSHLQRGKHNLIGTVIWDLQQAAQARDHGKPQDDASLVIDPTLEWFRMWVDTVIAARQQDPAAYPISSDLETPDKAGGQDEGEITADDKSFQILRVNVACHPDEGVTVPFAGPFIDELRRLHRSPGPIWGWNYYGYDFARAVAAELLVEADFAKVVDLMWMAHVLQSDLPRGLGFWAPFYSAFGPWKHFADAEPARYGAIDGLQNHRVGFGIVGDLQRLGMWGVAERHVTQLATLALRPAQLVGVKVDRERLTIFKAELGKKASVRLERLQGYVPDNLRNLTPKGGLTHRPADNVLHVKATAFTRKGTKRAGKEASEIKLDLYKQATIVEREIEREVWVCATCGEAEVQRRHRCAPVERTHRHDAGLVRGVAASVGSPTTSGGDAGREGAVGPRTPSLSLESRHVTRYFWSEPFNPDSWQQVLAYIKHRKHAPGKAKKTHKDSTNRETLERLTKTGDPFYATLLDYRAIQKVKGTYVDGTERRLDHEDRIHPEYTFKPSTQRLSYVNPNITNVVADKGGQASLASGFRRCVVAGGGSRLLEVDFAGSEQVDVGWFSRDPRHIRLARLGIHAGLASHVLGRPYDPHASEADLAAYFGSIKSSPDTAVQLTYDRSKRFVHGFSYGLTLHGMVLQFPELFPTLKVAEQYAEIFRGMAPAVPAWQKSTRERAFRQKYLGGPGDHPFGYKHWFWSVYTYKKITAGQYWTIVNTCRRKGLDESEAPVAIINGQHFKISLGEDGKRCVAFYPQSTTAGKLKEAMLRLFTPGAPHYIGEAYFGRTPLRAPIHDSLLLEIPIRSFDLVASLVVEAMQQPFEQMPCPEEWGLGPYLSTGVSAKTGLDWQQMEKLSVTALGASEDRVTTAALDEDQEDVDDFGRAIA